MTEAALSGGAEAPVEVTGASIEAPNVETPNALGSQTPVAEKPEAIIEDKPAKTAGEAVRKAMEKVKADQAAKDAAKTEDKPKEQPKAEGKADPKAEAKALDKPAAERAPDGKFAPKAQDTSQTVQPAQQAPQQPQTTTESKGTIHEPPARLDAQAKAEWANAPESVKGAVHRTFREMEAGLEEHRQRWEPIKQYDDMAKQYGTNLPAALERYVAFDKHLSQNLFEGLEGVIRDKTGGQYGLKDIAAQVMGQQPNQTQSQNDATTHQLRQEIAALKQQLGGVVTHVKSQAETATTQQVIAFSEGKADFDALAPQIAEHIRAGLDLEAAYNKARQEAEELARTLGFVPAAQTQQPLSPAPTPPPINEAGKKSISGAPATGSDPASIKKNAASVPSIREALARAKARAG